MATAKVAIKGGPICETAKLFYENGVEIADWFEGELGPVHLISFYGDDEAGFKAVKTARKLGLYPHTLRRVWELEYDDGEHPSWELLFFYVPPSDPAPFGSRGEPVMQT